MTVNVLKSDPVLWKNGEASPLLHQTRVAECLVGDDTRSILFTACNDQVDLTKAGTTVILLNANIDTFKGSVGLAVDKWGSIEVTEPAKFVVKRGHPLVLC